MRNFLSAGLMAGLLALSFVADANAFSRNGTVSGPRGTSSVSANGSCAGGTCSRAITRTGPYGGSVSKSGSASCNSATCSGSSTTVGPHGGTVTRNSTISR